LPEWFGYIPIPGEIIVRLNGFVEVLLAIMLILGVYVRIIAAFLALHLFMIAASIGGATGVRDLVLAISTGLLALNVPDKWTLDAKQKKETLIEKLIHSFVRK